MLARQGQVGAREVRVDALGAVELLAALGQHPVPQHSVGHVVLHLAGHRTGVATNAAAQVDADGKLRHGYSPAFLISMSVSL